MERAFKGIWVPKEIWLDKNLNWVEKVLLVEINSLDNEDGCFATNAYFADFFGLSKDRISNLISRLAEKGYISVEMKYKPNSKQIDKRIVKSNYTYRHKQLEGIGENADTPIGENAKDNNTSFNNTVNKRYISKNGAQPNKLSRHKYGEYKNVLLSNEELEKLKNEFPNDWKERIERLSEYCASSGKSYKNYLATIRTWARKEKPKQVSRVESEIEETRRQLKEVYGDDFE